MERRGLALPRACCVALDKSLNLSESLFLLLQNGDEVILTGLRKRWEGGGGGDHWKRNRQRKLYCCTSPSGQSWVQPEEIP